MSIISWDVGVIHLAYCILKKKKKTVKILDWNIIDLLENDRVRLTCCAVTKKDKVCGKKAMYQVMSPYESRTSGFCKTHIDQSKEIWSEEDTDNLFKITSKQKKCTHIKSTSDEQCGKNAKYYDKLDKNYYCTPHYKSKLNKYNNLYCAKAIKNTSVADYPTAKLQLNLINKLDSLVEHFAELKVDQVVIENQPSFKNPKMKSISNTLFDYFMIRGYIDKPHGLNISLVKFMCPNNKLKVNEDNTIEVFKANKNKKNKYKLTKELSVKYTRQLIDDNKEMLEFFESCKKKDDICDAYLQGLYYLNFMIGK